MRLEKHHEEMRRISIVKYLVETPRTCTDIATFDGTIRADNVPVFITRLRQRGIAVSKHTRGHYMAYKLDMPLVDALKLIEPKPYAPSTEKHKKSQSSEAIKARAAVQSEQRALDKARKEHVPAGEFHPWWGLITRREPIDCGLTV